MGDEALEEMGSENEEEEEEEEEEDSEGSENEFLMNRAIQVKMARASNQ